MNKFLILSAVFFLISYAECLDSVNVEFLYKSDAEFDCTSANVPAAQLEWYRVNKTDSTTEKVADYYENKKTAGDKDKVTFDGTKMTLRDLRRPDIEADYYCKSSEGEEKVNFVKQIKPFLKVPEKSSQTVVSGGFVEFECALLYGDENKEKVQWTWIKNGTQLDEDDSTYTVTNTPSNSVLLIKPVKEEHKGMITCKVENEFGDYSTEFQLRVKDTLAALWPFLGIVAEVLILCIIIIAYEKKCNKKNKSTDETEQSENLMGKESQGDLKKRNPRV